MTAPPRTIERLLAGLGAKPDFRNAVLGDLAEEFTSRVETDGVEAATRWYRREAVRAVPHLLLSWVRGARRDDITHLAGVIATAYTGMLILGLVAGGVLVGIVRAMGYAGPLFQLSIAGSTAILSGMMVFALVVGGGAGFLAAWLDSRAPLVTSATFGTLMLVVAFTAQHAFGGAASRQFPTWYLAGSPILEFIGAIAGGVWCVRASRRANVGA